MEKISIVDLFKPEELTQKSDGNYKTICPDCGLQGGRTEGFILFPETNMAYCHSSGKSFTLIETAALKLKVINCIEGREKGQNTSPLKGELFKQTLDLIKENYGEEFYYSILDTTNIRSQIQVPGNNRLISDFADELGENLSRKQILFFRSDINEIVEIGKIKEANGEIVETGFVILQPKRFITIAERYFKPWAEMFGRFGTYQVSKSMNSTDASVVLASSNFQEKLPVIKRLFNLQLPIICNRELTFPKEGYDPRFASYLPYHSVKITNPEMSLGKAKEMINKIFEEFCFKDEQDKTNAIAAFITPALKGLFPSFNTRTPVFFYRGNRERTGKDYCAGLTGILYEGAAIEEAAISTGEKNGNTNEEVRKKIMSILIQGRKRYHSSNNKGYINNAMFEQITTAKVWSDRILGKNETKTIENDIDFSLSGNLNVTTTPDLANRCVFINLFFDKEDPNARTFKNPDLHEWVNNNRGEILSAIYVLMKNWIDKGTPKGTKPFASFPQWAEICGGIMEAAELGNPCKKSGSDFGTSLDEDSEQMKDLFFYFAELNLGSDTWLKKKDIVRTIKESEESFFSYLDFEKKSDQVKFGIKFDKFVGRILGDVKLVVKDIKVRPARREYQFLKQENTHIENEDPVSTAQEPQFVNSEVALKCVQSPNCTNKINVGNLGNLGNLDTSPKFHSNYKKLGVLQTLPTLPTLPRTKIKQKSDREVQFWESEECKDIQPKHNKEEVLNWITQNPGATAKEMYFALSVGSFKFLNELIAEKKVIKKENKLEVVKNE